MDISIGMVEEKLTFPILSTYYPHDENAKMNIKKCVLYKGETFLKGDVLYLVTSKYDKPPILRAEPGACAITIGPPPDYFPENTAYIAVAPDARIEELWDVVAQVFMEYNEMERQLYTAVQDGESLQKLVDIITPIFKNEIYVRSNSMRILARSRKVITFYKNAGLGQPDKYGNLAIDAADHVRSLGGIPEVNDAREPYLYVDEKFPNRAIATNGFYMNSVVARILVAEVDNPFRPFDYALLGFFSEYVIRCFEQGIYRDNKTMATHLQVITKSLLDGERVQSKKYKYALHLQQWESAERFMCAVAVSRHIMGTTEQPLYYTRLLSLEFSETCSLTYNNRIVCVINLDYSNKTEAELKKRFKQFLMINDLSAGYSNVFSDYSQVASFHRQAVTALEIGMEQKPDDTYYDFSSYAADYIIGKAVASEERDHFCSQDIKKLLEHDRQNGTQYCKTLKAYISNHLNASRTAKDLFIHRETMVYRLKRIKELTSIDFDDSNQYLYLLLSLRILETSIAMDEKP